MGNKARLFIIGASNLARELESWLDAIPTQQRDWELQGFLHNLEDGNPLEGMPTDYTILGDWETFPFAKGDRCLIGVADASWREKIYNTLKDTVWFMPFIDPSAIIGKFTAIPDGAIIAPLSSVSTNVTLGTGTLIYMGSQIGHDSILGEFSSIMANVDLGGFVTIGTKVFMGSNSTIIPHKEIASNTIIGAGCIVIRDILSEGLTVVGNPGKVINS